MSNTSPFSDSIAWMRENIPVPEPIIDTFNDRPEDYSAPYYEISASSGAITFSGGQGKTVRFNVKLTYAECKPIDSEYKGLGDVGRIRLSQAFVLRAMVKLTLFVRHLIDKKNNPFGEYFRMNNEVITFRKATDSAGEGPNQNWVMEADFELNIAFGLCEKCL